MTPETLKTEKVKQIEITDEDGIRHYAELSRVEGKDGVMRWGVSWGPSERAHLGSYLTHDEMFWFAERMLRFRAEGFRRIRNARLAGEALR